MWLSFRDQRKHLERDLRKRSVLGHKSSSETPRPNLGVFSAATAGLSSSTTTNPVEPASGPDPAVWASALQAAEQRGLEHLRQVMFSGEDMVPISRDDSDLDDDGFMNEEPDFSEDHEEPQLELPQPSCNVSVCALCQAPLMPFARIMPRSETLHYQCHLPWTLFYTRLAQTHSNILQRTARRPRCPPLVTFTKTRSYT